MPYIFPVLLALLPPVFPENILEAEKLLQKAKFLKGMLFPSIQCVSGIWSHFSHSGFCPQCPHSKAILLSTAMLMATFDDIFDCCAGAACQPVETTKEAQLNNTPVTNKLPEMEISRCLCSQTGEHDEMKKNSSTLFCLFKLCNTRRNTNPGILNECLHHAYLIIFFLTRTGAK